MSDERILGLSPVSWGIISGAGLLFLWAKRKFDAPILWTSKYFTLEELTVSEKARQLGLDNSPRETEQRALAALVRNVLDPLREHLGRAVRINSAYRSPAVNVAVGGAKESQHITGEASDIEVSGLPAVDLARIIAAKFPFDELIWYAPERGGHVHVSFSQQRNRRRTLRAPVQSSGYVPWSPDEDAVSGFRYTGNCVAS